MKRRDVLAGAGIGALGVMSGQAPAFATDGFFVPAEEDPHEATFMQWLVSRAVYDDRRFLDDVQDTIAEVANTISAFEPVIMLASREDHALARAKLTGDVTLWDIPTEDLWCRDAGPIFVVN